MATQKTTLLPTVEGSKGQAVYLVEREPWYLDKAIVTALISLIGIIFTAYQSRHNEEKIRDVQTEVKDVRQHAETAAETGRETNKAITEIRRDVRAPKFRDRE